MKRSTATSLLTATLLVASVAPLGAADKYPPGPGGTCPDTLKIFNVQDTGASCHPAVLDTVLGVAGIITGFDLRASAYGFYLQNNGFSSWSGIDIFTGATNYNGPVAGSPSGGNLAIGDSVVVYGTVQEFQGETEIEGPDVVQGTNDIIIRKVGTGPVPAPIVGTTTTFNYLPSNPVAEQYEGMLVRIPTTMKVARTSLTGGLSFNSFLLVNEVGDQSDSVHVDGQTLPPTEIVPPPVGTLVGSVQGILNQRTTGVSSYRIQLRNGNDIVINTPPNLASVFAIADNVVRVVFDRDVTTASAEDESNYSLSSLGSVDLATQVTGSTVDLTITNGLADGDVEGVTVVDVGSLASGLAMTTPQSLSFVNGVVEPSVLQEPDPTALSGMPCEDRSRYAGVGTAFGTLRVSVRGVSVAKFGSLYYLVGESGGQRNGISVFGPTQPLNPGNRYLVVGLIQEFGAGGANGRETEIVSTNYVVDEGPAVAPDPLVETVGVLADTTCDNTVPQLFTHLSTGEDYECTLVRVIQVRVTENRTAGQSFFVAGPYGSFADTILISNSNSSYTYDPDSLDVLQITGVLSSNSQSSRRFRIQPRNNADIVELGNPTGVDETVRSIEFAASPNPARVPRMVFTLPRAAEVELTVYDLFGRRVQTLASGSLEAGTHTREWDGRGAGGSLVRSGMYFYKLRVGNEYEKSIRGVKLN
jgi:hypothetical protein